MERKHGRKYWVLKTTEGRGGPDYWDRFVSESVVAINWHNIPVRPHTVSQECLESALRATYPNDDDKHGARTIRKFVGIGVGDRVLLCQGYAASTAPPTAPPVSRAAPVAAVHLAPSAAGRRR